MATAKERRMTLPTKLPDKRMLHVARELALDIYPLEDILANARVTDEEFERWSGNPHFQSILTDEVAKWTAATNTHERVRVKAAVVMEDWMETAAGILNDRTEPLSGRAEVAKLLSDLSGMRQKAGADAGGGERLSITINLGEDKTLTIDKPIKVIDHVEDM